MQRKFPPTDKSVQEQNSVEELRRDRFTSVVFTVVTDHEHDFPLKYVVIHKPAGDPWQVLRSLHVFELPAEEAGCS